MDILVCQRKTTNTNSLRKKTSLIKLGKLIWRFCEHKHIKINSINTQDYSQFTSKRPSRTLLITESRLTIIRSDSGSSDMLWKSWGCWAREGRKGSLPFMPSLTRNQWLSLLGCHSELLSNSAIDCFTPPAPHFSPSPSSSVISFPLQHTPSSSDRNRTNKHKQLSSFTSASALHTNKTNHRLRSHDSLVESCAAISK